MIFFRDYKPDARHVLDLQPVRNYARAYMEFIDWTYRQAILNHLGHWPSDEEIKRYAHEFVMPDGTRHLAWLAGPPVIGEKADLTKTIATVQPLYPNRTQP